MTEQELQQQRAQSWHTAGNPVRTMEEARAFLDDVGFCTQFPVRTLPPLPSFIGAFAGTAGGLPDVKHAFADARAQQATDLMVRLLRERDAYEMSFADGSVLLISPALFPFFYALASDRNPKAAPKMAHGARISPLAAKVFETIHQKGALSKEQLRQAVGGALSTSALDRALGELWSILKITRVNYTEQQGAFWDALYRWAPEVIKEGINISEPEAISAILSKYLEAVVAAEREEIEKLLSCFTSRAKVREAVNALLAARELSFVSVGSRTMVRMTPAPEQQRRHIHG